MSSPMLISTIGMIMIGSLGMQIHDAARRIAAAAAISVVVVVGLTMLVEFLQRDFFKRSLWIVLHKATIQNGQHDVTITTTTGTAR